MEMDCTGETKGVRRLAELLQDRQEPFALDSYLSERGYGGSRSSVNGGKKQEKKRTSRFSKLLRALCDVAVVIHGRTRNKKPSRNREGECSGVCRNAREAVDLERFSSASSTTVYNSCSDCDPVERPNPVWNARAPSEGGSSQQSDDPREGEIKQVDADRNIQWRFQNKNKQPSTVPVTARETSVEHFNEKPQQQVLQVFSAWQEVNDSTSRLGLPKRITEDSLSSAYTFEILFHCKQDGTSFAQSTQPLGPKTSPDSLNTKRVLWKTKQLLFDCVKEVIESYGRKERARKNKNSIVGTEEIGKIIYEKIVGWGRTRGNEKNIDELLYLDYLETAEEWQDYANHGMQISLEIGDALMEDISNEIVAELICH